MMIVDLQQGEREMTPKEITTLAGHRLVPPWVMKLVMDAVEIERSRISETFWASVNSCVTTDELGVEFMQKFYAVHIFGHWLDKGEK